MQMEMVEKKSCAYTVPKVNGIISELMTQGCVLSVSGWAVSHACFDHFAADSLGRVTTQALQQKE